jgi:hypothetical protein
MGMQDVPFPGCEQALQAYPDSRVVGSFAVKIVCMYSVIFEHLTKIERAARNT